MDALYSLIILLAFILSLVLYRTFFGKAPRFGARSMLASAERSDYTLDAFLKSEGRRKGSKNLLFSEEKVISSTYRYNGRFDGIIVHWENGPILDAVIERKFPRQYLPYTTIEEDMFQGSLYALALKEKGLSVSSTRIITIYCLQEEAEKCIAMNDRATCSACKKGEMFSQRFNEKRTMMALQRLDEIWYGKRKPEPRPSLDHCRKCPYGKYGICDFAVK